MTIETGLLDGPAGSASIRCGSTWVLCAASVEPRIPRWLEGKGRGWVTAEYAMLPSATNERSPREGWRGKWPRGRTQEIGRLIGRALRSVVHLDRLGECSIVVDCDVLQADGGTRTASVTGGFVALVLALEGLRKKGQLKAGVLRDTVCAVSVGMLEEGGAAVLDMPYEEDHRAEVDLNLVSTGAGQIVEVQCTAEGTPFSTERLDEMIALGLLGNEQLTALQRKAIAGEDIELGRLIEGSGDR